MLQMDAKHSGIGRIDTENLHTFLQGFPILLGFKHYRTSAEPQQSDMFFNEYHNCVDFGLFNSHFWILEYTGCDLSNGSTQLTVVSQSHVFGHATWGDAPPKNHSQV